MKLIYMYSYAFSKVFILMQRIIGIRIHDTYRYPACIAIFRFPSWSSLTTWSSEPSGFAFRAQVLTGPDDLWNWLPCFNYSSTEAALSSLQNADASTRNHCDIATWHQYDSILVLKLSDKGKCPMNKQSINSAQGKFLSSSRRSFLNKKWKRFWFRHIS